MRFIYFIYVLLVFIVFTIIFFPIILGFSMFNTEKSRKIVFNIVRIWIKYWLLLIGMPVTSIGKSPIEKCVMVSNHISYMDTLVLFPSTKNYFRILGNKEMSKIPLLGVPYKQIGILVDRTNNFSRLRSFRLMLNVINKGISIHLFPEGRFNNTGNVLKDFYDGAFRLAISSKTPIYPIILPDTNDRWDNSAVWKWSPGRNRVIFLEPINTDNYTLNDVSLLKNEVYGKMENELKKYRK